VRRYQVVLIAGATALLAIAGTLIAIQNLHLGQGTRGGSAHNTRIAATSRPSAASTGKPVSTGSPVEIRSAAPGFATPETNPALAEQYAEKAVGNCLESAWGNANYTNFFVSYLGDGEVEFGTGTAASPTGNYASLTLIDVRVYTGGAVDGMASNVAGGPPPSGKGNAPLAYWGCRPSKSAASGVPQPFSRPKPPGLDKDGPLDVGCKLNGAPGYTSYHAVITFYNPGTAAQSVSSFLLQFGSNGILLSQQIEDGDWNVLRREDIVLAVDAPASANSCKFGGFNP
jgi:hypothetical protein